MEGAYLVLPSWDLHQVLPLPGAGNVIGGMTVVAPDGTPYAAQLEVSDESLPALRLAAMTLAPRLYIPARLVVADPALDAGTMPDDGELELRWDLSMAGDGSEVTDVRLPYTKDQPDNRGIHRLVATTSAAGDVLVALLAVDLYQLLYCALFTAAADGLFADRFFALHVTPTLEFHSSIDDIPMALDANDYHRLRSTAPGALGATPAELRDTRDLLAPTDTFENLLLGPSAVIEFEGLPFTPAVLPSVLVGRPLPLEYELVLVHLRPQVLRVFVDRVKVVRNAVDANNVSRSYIGYDRLTGLDGAREAEFTAATWRVVVRQLIEARRALLSGPIDGLAWISSPTVTESAEYLAWMLHARALESQVMRRAFRRRVRLTDRDFDPAVDGQDVGLVRGWLRGTRSELVSTLVDRLQLGYWDLEQMRARGFVAISIDPLAPEPVLHRAWMRVGRNIYDAVAAIRAVPDPAGQLAASQAVLVRGGLQAGLEIITRADTYGFFVGADTWTRESFILEGATLLGQALQQIDPAAPVTPTLRAAAAVLLPLAQQILRAASSSATSGILVTRWSVVVGLPTDDLEPADQTLFAVLRARGPLTLADLTSELSRQYEWRDARLQARDDRAQLLRDGPEPPSNVLFEWVAERLSVYTDAGRIRRAGSVPPPPALSDPGTAAGYLAELERRLDEVDLSRDILAALSAAARLRAHEHIAVTAAIGTNVRVVMPYTAVVAFPKTMELYRAAIEVDFVPTDERRARRRNWVLRSALNDGTLYDPTVGVPIGTGSYTLAGRVSADGSGLNDGLYSVVLRLYDLVTGAVADETPAMSIALTVTGLCVRSCQTIRPALEGETVVVYRPRWDVWQPSAGLPPPLYFQFLEFSKRGAVADATFLRAGRKTFVAAVLSLRAWRDQDPAARPVELEPVSAAPLPYLYWPADRVEGALERLLPSLPKDPPTRARLVDAVIGGLGKWFVETPARLRRTARDLGASSLALIDISLLTGVLQTHLNQAELPTLPQLVDELNRAWWENLHQTDPAVVVRVRSGNTATQPLGLLAVGLMVLAEADESASYELDCPGRRLVDVYADAFADKARVPRASSGRGGTDPVGELTSLLWEGVRGPPEPTVSSAHREPARELTDEYLGDLVGLADARESRRRALLLRDSVVTEWYGEHSTDNPSIDRLRFDRVTGVLLPGSTPVGPHYARPLDVLYARVAGLVYGQEAVAGNPRLLRLAHVDFTEAYLGYTLLQNRAVTAGATGLAMDSGEALLESSGELTRHVRDVFEGIRRFERNR